MATSIKLNPYYWDPTGVAVRTYTQSGTTAPTHTGNSTLGADWRRYDCGGFDNKMAYPNSIDGVQDFGVPEGTDATQSITFQNAFSSKVPILAAAGTGDGNIDDGHWKDYAYGVTSVDTIGTAGGTIKVSVGPSSGYRWVPNLWWIAFGL